MYYTAFIHKSPDTLYGVSFPDFPGCIAVGHTVDEAMRHGIEALSFHVEGMAADGESIPSPRPLEDILADAELAEEREGAVVSALPLVREFGTTTRINVSLDPGLLQAIDAAAQRRKQTRSAFIASAVRKELTK